MESITFCTRVHVCSLYIIVYCQTRLTIVYLQLSLETCQNMLALHTEGE